ncbi:hypothetical protein BSL78_13058 [Apostichopus japonicus]|uniref:C2H2-type domain-containing protein n=1 Tax=Stichopus japonicus TaxID=307972 RepID=A0A2G8KPX5_STIJA|nr:hypothetical protein BSL78_13058 [Apostichopus japonicus]
MSIPFSCPLSPSRNVYGDNEKHKLWEDTSRWSCQYCGKAFFGQEYLDMHFENRHLETINQKIMKLCVPPGLSGMKKYSFINDMRLAVCGFLTCDRYDERPIQECWNLPSSHFHRCLVTETIDPNYPDSYAERKDKYVAIRIPREDSELRYRHREDFYDAYR